MFKQKIFSRVLLTNWLRRPVKLSLGVGLFFILVGGLFFNLASPVVAEAGISNATKGSLDLMKATAKEANLHNDSSVYNISKEGDKG